MNQFYNPANPPIEDLVTRANIGNKTQEFIRTPTGKAIVERAITQYKDGIDQLQSMCFQEWSGSSEEELKQYRSISLSFNTPLKVLQWLNSIISDGETAEKLSRYKEAE